MANESKHPVIDSVLGTFGRPLERMLDVAGVAINFATGNDIEGHIREKHAQAAREARVMLDLQMSEALGEHAIEPVPEPTLAAAQQSSSTTSFREQ